MSQLAHAGDNKTTSPALQAVMLPAQQRLTSGSVLLIIDDLICFNPASSATLAILSVFLQLQQQLLPVPGIRVATPYV